jgi:hypothetical protein
MFENTEFKGVPSNHRTKLNGLVYEPVAIYVRGNNGRRTERVLNSEAHVWSSIEKTFAKRNVRNAFVWTWDVDAPSRDDGWEKKGTIFEERTEIDILFV